MKNILIGVCIALYGLSLLLPAFNCKAWDESFPGWGVLMIGWIGVIGFDPRWYANLCYFFYVLSAGAWQRNSRDFFASFGFNIGNSFYFISGGWM